VTQPTTPQKRNYTTDKICDRQTSAQIILPLPFQVYEKVMVDKEQAKEIINYYMAKSPELFPDELNAGYVLNGWTEPSVKMPDVRFRRIRAQTSNNKGQRRSFTVGTCDILSYRRATVDEVEKALFMKSFGVPDWALTYVFGRNDAFWYRLSASLGRHSIVGTTVKKAGVLPDDLLADEKHTKAHGEKWYISTTVGKGCVLGASVSETADSKGLEEAYGVFKTEAQALKADYAPRTVNTDGWAATGKAWLSLFPTITILLCFLHAFIKIRSRCKRLGDVFETIKTHVWDIYHAESADDFMLQVGILESWLKDKQSDLSKTAFEAIEKLCQKADKFRLAYDHPQGHRTSNMLDRQMELMARWLSGGRHYHGNLQSAELRIRGWALLHNYRPFCPRAKVSDNYQARAHKLNGFVYRNNWLENMLVATSCQGFRLVHKKRQN